MNRTENVFRRIAVAAALMIAIASAVPALGAGGADPAAYDLENRAAAAALDENWSEVAKILGTVDESELSPVGRLLKGHACLALNRNNESLCLFLYSAGQTDIERWDRWTKYFMTEHPDAEIAMYLRADAHARLEKWEKARERLDAFLRRYPQLDEVPVTFREKEPHVALALNARGVVLCALGEDGLASLDINAARELCPELADAHATAGARAVLISQGASAAKDAFDEAIRHSTQFAMAFNGRACARIALSPREFDKAESDLKIAANTPECDRLATYNLSRLRKISIRKLQPGCEKLLAKNPGTPLGKRWEAFVNGVGDISNNVGNHSGKAWNDFTTNNRIDALTRANTDFNVRGSGNGTGAFIPGMGAGTGNFEGSAGGSTTFNPNMQNKAFGFYQKKWAQQDNFWSNKINQTDQSYKQNWDTFTAPGGVHTASGEDHMEGKPWRLLTLFGLRYNILPEIPQVSLAEGSPLARETEEVQ
ncbi:MAG: hypothetical protein HQ592_00330 [Planctomycetes bacterium]|nr:hypothetical protein [Planctomycetota bacterium]